MSVAATIDVNFSELMTRLLGLLSDKERDVIERRFSLKKGGKKETLDRIGKSYSITRERVRQIEAVALKKLTRISMDPAMRQIHSLAFDILVSNGKVMLEDHLVSAMLKQMNDTNSIDANSVKLAMRVSDKLVKQEKNQFYKAFWRTSDIGILQVKDLIKSIQKAMRAEKNVLTVAQITKSLENKFVAEMIGSVLEVDWLFKQTEDGWGLASWRHINPKSIKDRIMIIFKNHGKPMHFSEIISAVLTEFGNHKMVTHQAIHNELIRHADFALVGRGLYGLKEWGLASGTVCDLIVEVLKENDGPMKRQDIINGVLAKREIRMGTISLNLQKYDFFERVGRAVYQYVSEKDTRRRNLKRLRLGQ